MNSRLRPKRSASPEQQRADDGAADIRRSRPTELGRGERERRGSLERGADGPTIVTSRPSRIHVTPSAITTRQCQRDHGSGVEPRGQVL